MKMAKLNLNSTKLIIFAALFLLLGAIVYQRFGGKQDTLHLLQTIFPEASSYENCEGKYPSYRVFDDNQHLLGYGIMTEASGYGGPLRLLTGIDPKGHITEIEIIENYETPLYIQKVMNNGFLDKFLGKSLYDRLHLNEDLDAISGATVSSEGITTAVRKAINQVGTQEFGLTEKKKEKIKFGWEELLLLALFAIISFSIWKKSIKLRPFVLVFSVFFLGFWLNSPINLGNIASLMSGNAPSFLERPFWFLLIMGTLLLILVLGKNIYCAWLCPFGAVQEGFNKALGLVKFTIPRKYLIHANKIRLTLTWFALMVAFLFVNPSIASYEPFSAFFKGQANKGQWLLMGLVLFMSITTNRLWCRFFCPTGAIMDLVASIRRTVKKWLRVKNSKESMGNRGKTCVNKRGEIQSQDASYVKDGESRAFLSLLVGFIILILFSLFMNAGVL